VTELAKVGITKVGSGGFFFVVGNNAGEIWGWGATKYNRFGVGGPDLIPVPKKIPLKFKVNKISAGNWHTLVTDN
jgi:alpha-tubulin suppressor-like RCC1 family protein